MKKYCMANQLPFWRINCFYNQTRGFYANPKLIKTTIQYVQLITYTLMSIVCQYIHQQNDSYNWLASVHINQDSSQVGPNKLEKILSAHHQLL